MTGGVLRLEEISQTTTFLYSKLYKTIYTNYRKTTLFKNQFVRISLISLVQMIISQSYIFAQCSFYFTDLHIFMSQSVLYYLQYTK